MCLQAYAKAELKDGLSLWLAMAGCGRGCALIVEGDAWRKGEPDQQGH